ncbi:leucine carboxyl methyltransferase, putative [Perkinsus marinus ATCC 50983]|uniref:[phosphatase 2A protein]-leucine-carboxy methyltransferase n=1 Tax=Perkinsus marinus (strain ATCC 50983 / TXsc) TaxID=423536 RepID=C5LQH4_PERM5|nr:leucine carboxyl methyltransferase, putative [Perkinsus marinus ATCC 50983]EER01020.1 leucine carboxyl methyltransferase, putative [Perkinsus marinus ATCC 50983]|eukprot:XP_002768302.1 leucine carboxyl methyltransferase, putative [Perkinsus marinus ATCC 50983]
MGDLSAADGGRDSPVFSCGGMGDEEAIQRTADEAAESKWSAVSKGYYNDAYIMQMCRHWAHRQPVINRGYFARVQAMRNAILDFISDVKTEGKDAIQIVSLGAGIDTTYWWLSDQEEIRGIKLRYLELDMPEVVDRKTSMILRREALWSRLGKSKDDLVIKDGCGARCIRADTYRSACCDLRAVETVSGALGEIGFASTGVPTLFIAECVLV